MILVALLMATAPLRCVDDDLCPSEAEIIAALHENENNLLVEMSSGPDIVIDVHFLKILGVDNVVCGNAEASAPKTINCLFRIRHPGKYAYEIATLTNDKNHWKIDNFLIVYAPR